MSLLSLCYHSEASQVANMVKNLPGFYSCSFPGENARSWEALGEARPGQSSLSAGALRWGGGPSPRGGAGGRAKDPSGDEEGTHGGDPTSRAQTSCCLRSGRSRGLSPTTPML